MFQSVVLENAYILIFFAHDRFNRINDFEPKFHCHMVSLPKKYYAIAKFEYPPVRPGAVGLLIGIECSRVRERS